MNARALLVLMIGLGVTSTGFALTNYVGIPGTPGVTPKDKFTNWATAATNIQDAMCEYGNESCVDDCGR